jgi:DNA-binding NtrC family response regulator
LLGESGSGKEVLARHIHAASSRAGGPFIAVNCATLNKELLESELFGHEKGAFTGAVRAKQGRVEQAAGGTLFLDEIAELDPAIQAKLLRVLQEREFERVGGTRTIPADVRIVCATHRDLARAIEEGRFREDLYYRINIVTVRVPPLRGRREDLAPLLEHFLERHSREAARPKLGITPEARRLLESYSWPGNVRELSNVVERMVVLAPGDTAGIEDLPEEIRDARQPRRESGAPAEPPGAAGGPVPSYHDAVREAKRRILRDALDRADNVQTRAAKSLGLTQPYMARLMKNLDVRRK